MRRSIAGARSTTRSSSRSRACARSCSTGASGCGPRSATGGSSGRAATDLTRARRIARYKSGKYTIERPLHVGAALAGRYADLHESLSAYGDPLGEAFQLRDDLLGAFGDEAQTGKPVGDDLREGKPTPLLAIASDRAGDDQ